MKKNVYVFGTGISGLSIGKLLADKFNVKVCDKADKIGGLIKCSTENGVLFHRVGGHVFNSRNQKVLDWFWSFFDKENEFIAATRNAKILMNGKYVGYPIENYLFQLPENETNGIIDDILKLLKEKPKTSDNFYDFLLNSFGQSLFDLYFEPYNKKIWKRDLINIPLPWLDGKLPMPNLEDIVRNNILRKGEENMVHSTFFYPKNNGSQFIINRLAENQDINLNYKLESISYDNQELIINNTTKTDYVIYSGDVRTLNEVVKINDSELQSALNAVANLKANGTYNWLCETDNTDLSWLYLPENQFAAHRIIYTGNFSESNNALDSRKTCVVEFSGHYEDEFMLEELSRLPGNLKPISHNYEPSSYIIHDFDTAEKIENLKTLLKKYNIYLIGRFAEWQYYNMDKCIERAFEIVEEIGV